MKTDNRKLLPSALGLCINPVRCGCTSRCGAGHFIRRNYLPDASHQGCTIQGSSPDSLIFQGGHYIETAFGYSESHMWRNFGIIAAWLTFFVALF